MKITRNLMISLLLLGNTAMAQNQPKTQHESVWVSNIRLDGALPDHDQFLKAYNRQDHLFYTVANDDKNLYLFIYCNERLGLSKLIYGGVTFTVTDAVDKNRSISTTFPTTDYNQNFPLARFSYNYYNDLSRDKEKNKQAISELRITLNKLVATNFKEIAAEGIDGATSPTLSVYNEQGIKAVAAFDNDIALTYELAIPLKYAKLSGDKLLYNIRLNGRVLPKQNPMAPPPPRPAGGSADMTGLYLDSPSNFGGEYQLAIK